MRESPHERSRITGQERILFSRSEPDKQLIVTAGMRKTHAVSTDLPQARATQGDARNHSKNRQSRDTEKFGRIRMSTSDEAHNVSPRRRRKRAWAL